MEMSESPPEHDDKHLRRQEGSRLVTSTWTDACPFARDNDTLGHMTKLITLLCTGLAALTFVLVTPSQSEAQYGTQPPQQLYYQNTTVARYNPIGLINRFQMQYRHRLFHSGSIFTRDNHIGAGVYSQFSPAFARGGPHLEIRPMSLLVLSASYEFVSYFGAFGHLNSFADPNADFSDTALEAADEAGTSYALLGRELTIGIIGQIKLGPLAIRANTRFIHGDYDLENSDSVYYDPVYDALRENNAWMVTSDIDFLYLRGDHITGGLRYTITAPQYPSSECDGQPCSDNGPFDRFGFVFAYTFFKEYRARFNGPTVLLLTQWHLRHRFRTGEDSSQVIPQILLGFDFRGDLLNPHN